MSRPVALVLRAIGLGDMVTGLPALAMLRAARPGHRLVGAVPGRFAPLLTAPAPATGTPLLDEVVPTDALGPLAAPAGPDVAVDLHGNGPASRDPLRALGPGRLVAFTVDAAWDPDEHDVARWCRLVAAAFPGTPAPTSTVGLLPVPAAGAPVAAGTVVVHPGAGYPARCWPPARWAAVVAALRAAGHPVVVTGTGAEAGAAHAVAGDGARVLLDAPAVELAALVARAALVCSADTGVAHLAAAYARPTVTLFGPMPPRLWGPPDHPRHRVLFAGDPAGPPGDPHAGVVDPLLLALQPDRVLAEVGPALAAGPGALDPAPREVAV